MTSKQKKIALYIGIGVLAISGLVYLRKRNEAEIEALMKFIDSQYTEKDLSKSGDEAIARTKALKLDPNNIRIGNLKGSIKDPKIKDALAKAIVAMQTAISGPSTDAKSFYTNFMLIKSKNTMNFADQVYKAMNGEGLFEAMKGESVLYNSAYGTFNDTQTLLGSIPFINGYWSPVISKWLKAIPNY